MAKRFTKVRMRRHWRKSQRQVEDLSSQAEQQIEQHLYKRFDRLMPVKRFVTAWVGLVVLLISLTFAQNLNLSGYYQQPGMVPGGIYTEGVKGRFTNASPLYATSDVDTTVSRLLFASLLTYNRDGKLVGDLAESYTVEDNGATYKLILKPGLVWHDGKPLTSKDVAFTFQLIQNPDVQSPLQQSWQGVEVTAPDARTVVFKLPGVLASFPYNLTTGIVPEHILGRIAPEDMRSADFNTVRPVGAGPFSWQAVEVEQGANPNTAQQQVALEPFARYHAGQPKLQKFIVRAYADEGRLVEAFERKDLTALEGVNTLPEKLQDKTGVIEHSLTQRAATMVFFKTSEGVLADANVRRALVQAANVPVIMDGLPYTARQVRGPLLTGQTGYDATHAQIGHDVKAAASTLNELGWKRDANGQRRKDGQPLAITLSAANTPEYRMVTKQLRQQWRAVGVRLDVQLLGPTDFQNAVKYHSYQALLNGISIGVDPDVFVYWDSSQADIRSSNRLNFSEYKNDTVDAALEAGRTRLDPVIRAVKYKPFLEQWQKDNPALALYQPRVLYVTNGRVDGLEDQPVTAAADRFINVHNWQIREARVTN